MLLRQNFRWCHVSRLQSPEVLSFGSRSDNSISGRRGHCCFAGTDIAFKQTRHWMPSAEIAQNAFNDFLLRRGHLKRKSLHEFFHIFKSFLNHKSFLVFEFLASFLSLKLNQENFFKSKPLAGDKGV